MRESILEKHFVTPAFDDTKRCFVFATNDAYAPYLEVALHSFIEQTSRDAYYDICILHTHVSPLYKKAILSLQKKHISLRFIDMAPFLAHIDATIFVTHAHFSKEAYYRFFIPHIFMHYEKVVYMDCDMIFLTDMNAAFAVDMQHKALAAVLEYKFKCKVEFDTVLRQYAEHVLKLHNVQQYFNSGFLIFHIPSLLSWNFTQKCLERLQEVQRPRTVDQCILNSILQGHIHFLDARWNVQTHVDVKELQTYVPQEEYKNYVQSLLKPHVIHYCSPVKPWNTEHIPFAKVWWQYAQKSHFYTAFSQGFRRG